MSFRLDVTFTGLCAFVKNRNTHSTAIPMMALLVDGTRALGETQVLALDGSRLRFHRPFVSFPLQTVSGTTAQYGIWNLGRERVEIEIVPDSDAKPREHEFDVTWLDEEGHPEKLDNQSEEQKRSFSWFMDIGQVAPGCSKIDPRALSLEGDALNVAAQVWIKAGRLTPRRWTKAVWEFENYLSKPQVHRRQFAHEAVLSFEHLKSATLKATPYAGGPPRMLPLAQAGGVLRIAIANLCDVNPLEWDTGRQPERDEDVKWLYELLSKSSRDEVIRRLERRSLPTPVPVQFVPANTGPGSGNCIPSRFPDQAF